MTYISTSFTALFLFSQKLWSVLSYLWSIYSAPRVVGKHVWTLVALCAAVAMVTAGLLYYWLSESLRYEPMGSLKVAAGYAATVFLLLLLCHPLRCVATVGLLSLSTRQGRRLLIQTCFAALLLNVVPNIAANVGTVIHVLRCTSEGFARSLLNSSDILNIAKGDLVKETIKAVTQDTLIQKLHILDNFMDINISGVKSRFTKISRKIEGDFLHTRDLVKDYKLLLSRILAVLFMFLLIFQSARYLKRYLTSLTFENEYLPGEESIKQPPDSSVGKSGPSKAARIGVECQSCVMSAVLVTLYFTAMTFIVVLDHVVFQVVHVSLPWFLDIPSTSASITVNFTMWSYTPALCLIPNYCRNYPLSHFQRDYSWAFSSDPALCRAAPSPPDAGLRVLLAGLWLLSYGLVLLEVFARRLRRKIAGAFFRPQADRRAAYLVEKLQAKRDRKQDILSVSVACV